MRYFLTFILIGILIPGFSQNKFQKEVTTTDLKEIISTLASDKMAGRKTGEKGNNQAAEYIRDCFKGMGLKLLGENGFQKFETVTDVTLGIKNSLKINGAVYSVEKDFMPLSFTKNTSLSAKAVFAGYGFDIDKDSIKWNDYKDIDAKGNWVIILRGDPDAENMHSPYMEFALERYKVITAKEKGAAGVIFVTGASQDKEDKLIALYYDKSMSDAEIPIINIKRSIIEQIFEQNKKSFSDYESKINKEKKPASFALEINVYAETEVNQQKAGTQNVVALLEGSDNILKNEYIVLGAHFDHLGMGGNGSGSRMPDTIAVHNGADDNASGVGGIIEIAGKFSSEKPKRSLLFVAFTGEEIGMLGSKEFIKNPPVDKKKIFAMMNFDMIGRMKPDKKVLTINGTGTALEWDTILKTCRTNRTFETAFVTDGYGPSDHASFYSENIPVLFFTTGAHEDYHTPFDDIEKLDIKGCKDIIDLTCDVISNISGRADKLSFREAGSKDKGLSGRRFKVTLGIIPDVSGAVKEGLNVDGVKKDGPAEKAGIKKGDIIIAIDGNKVSNVYDYMFRLSKLAKGKITSVEILRNGVKEIVIVQL